MLAVLEVKPKKPARHRLDMSKGKIILLMTTLIKIKQSTFINSYVIIYLYI